MLFQDSEEIETVSLAHTLWLKNRVIEMEKINKSYIRYISTAMYFNTEHN